MVFTNLTQSTLDHTCPYRHHRTSDRIYAYTIRNKNVHERKKHTHRQKSVEQGWTAVAIFSVVIVFFSFGYLGVSPTVIYSGSMQPTLQVGDIVIIQKISIENLKQGDIIQVTETTTLPMCIASTQSIPTTNKHILSPKGTRTTTRTPTPKHQIRS